MTTLTATTLNGNGTTTFNERTPQAVEKWYTGTHGQTRYWQTQPTDRPPMLCIHGYGGVIEHWRRFLPFVQEEYTVAALDLHNFGFSSPVQGAPTKEIWAAQAAELLEHLYTQPAVVVGHSMGGLVAGQLAYEYPHLVEALVLVDSLGPRRDKPLTPLQQALFGLVRTPGVGEFLAEILTAPWSIERGLRASYYDPERITPELLDAVSAPLRQPGGPAAYLAVSRSSRDALHLEFAPGEVTHSTLILWGDHDRSMPPTLADRLQRELYPAAEIALIAESGHCPFDEQPAATADRILSWLGHRS